MPLLRLGYRQSCSSSLGHSEITGSGEPAGMSPLHQPVKSSCGEELLPPAHSHVSALGSGSPSTGSLQMTAALANMLTTTSLETYVRSMQLTCHQKLYEIIHLYCSKLLNYRVTCTP